MSSDFSACHVVTISDEALALLCPEEFETFMHIFKSPYVSEDSVYRFIEYEESLGENWYSDVENGLPELSEGAWAFLDASLQQAWALLSDAFRVKTQVGDSVLSLYYGYHNPDEGSSYDDVSGRFWGVSGSRMQTPAGKALTDNLTDAFFVTWG